MGKKISINQLKRIIKESASVDSNMKKRVIKDVIAKFNSMDRDFFINDLIEAIAAATVNKVTDTLSNVPPNGIDPEEDDAVQMALGTLTAFIYNIVSDVVKNDDEYSAAFDYHPIEMPDTYD